MGGVVRAGLATGYWAAVGPTHHPPTLHTHTPTTHPQYLKIETCLIFNFFLFKFLVILGWSSSEICDSGSEVQVGRHGEPWVEDELRPEDCDWWE